MKWVKGNTLRIKVALTLVTVVDGAPVQSAYTPPEGSVVKASMRGAFKTYTFTPTVSGNEATFVDDGSLPVGCYGVEITVAEDDRNLRSFEAGQIQIVDSTSDLELGEFSDDNEYLDYAYYIQGETGNGIASTVLNEDYTLTITYTDGTSYTTPSIRGERGAAFTYEDFTEEQIAELQKPATDIAEEVAAAEALRVSAEEARESAEASRVSAENARANAEATRVSNDSARAAAETIRESNERSRQSAEVSRAEAEAARENSESARESAEQDREAAETERASAENERASNENTRIANEEARQSNETTRQAQETTRQTQTAQAIANAETATDRANAAAALNEELNEHPMIIGTNGNWWSWDADNDEYADTGTPSTNILAFGYDETTGEVFMDVVESSGYPNFAVENGDLVLEID